MRKPEKKVYTAGVFLAALYQEAPGSCCPNTQQRIRVCQARDLNKGRRAGLPSTQATQSARRETALPTRGQLDHCMQTHAAPST